MVSGNPAKAARQATVKEVRQAARAGKTFLLRPWAGTEVTVRTTNPDDAEAVVMALQPGSTFDYTEQARMVLHEIIKHVDYCMEANPKVTVSWLKRMYEAYVDPADMSPFEWRADD